MVTRNAARPRTTAAALLMALTLGGCAAPGTDPGAGAPTGAPTVAPSSPAGRIVALDEHDVGTTVTVPDGATVELMLHSTYWAAPRSSAPALLRPLGAATSSAAAVGPSCRPGSGCGTVVARFLAAGSGKVALTSSRSSCGEAMACAPGARTYTVEIVVTSP
jgi:hypothetical protein